MIENSWMVSTSQRKDQSTNERIRGNYFLSIILTFLKNYNITFRILYIINIYITNLTTLTLKRSFTSEFTLTYMYNK
jgi:hypothetical protein